MNQNIVLNQARQFTRKVYYAGTDALYEGMGLSYVRDYGTAATYTESRDTRVEHCDSTNNRWFAGVVARDYAANSAGQWIEIFEPGSVCKVANLIATTLGTTHLTCMASTVAAVSGAFIAGGFNGRGSAIALQSMTAITDPTSTAIGVFSASVDGSATYTSSTKTVTKTGAFAGVPATASLLGNEYIVVVAGTTDNAGAAASNQATQGRYRIVTKTSDDAVIVETAIASGNIDLAFYAVRGRPTVLAKLQDGIESGLVDWITPFTDGSGATANTVAVIPTGFTNVFGGFDLDNGNCTDTLADGIQIGERKGYKLSAAITTSDYVVTVTTGKTYDPAGADFSNALGALATLTFDTASEYWLGEWDGICWRTLSFGPDNSATIA